MAPPGHVLGPHDLLDAVHLLLVALAVPHGALLGVPQGALQGPDPLRRGPQTLLQLWQLAAQVGIVAHQLCSCRRGGQHECVCLYVGVSVTGVLCVLVCVCLCVCLCVVQCERTYLLVDLSELLQVVLQESDPLSLGQAASSLNIHLCTLIGWTG